MNHEQKTLNISIVVGPNVNSQYTCELSSDADGSGEATIRYDGATEEHAIAIALETLASQYRQAAEAQQEADWDAVERSTDGEPITKRYHVVLHYERLAEDVSKFEAMHNTIMGNTVVENAQISVIEVGDGKALPKEDRLVIEPIAKHWDY